MILLVLLEYTVQLLFGFIWFSSSKVILSSLLQNFMKFYDHEYEMIEDIDDFTWILLH